jgi:hypothetical protein
MLLLTATINWDLLAVALASLAILAWTRERPVAAGILVGLGAAAKLYPALLLGPMLLVALRAPNRARALADYAATLGAAVLAWVAVNLPVYLWAPDGWREFFTFNRDRRADFGSPWYAMELLWPGALPDRIDGLIVAVSVVLLALVAWLALEAPEPPRLAQLTPCGACEAALARPADLAGDRGGVLPGRVVASRDALRPRPPADRVAWVCRRHRAADRRTRLAGRRRRTRRAAPGV